MLAKLGHWNITRWIVFQAWFCFALFFRNCYCHVFYSHSHSPTGFQTVEGPLIVLNLWIYEDLALYIHKCSLADNIKEEPYELQFIKVSTLQFVSESIKYNLCTIFKRKIFRRKVRSSKNGDQGAIKRKCSTLVVYTLLSSATIQIQGLTKNL